MKKSPAALHPDIPRITCEHLSTLEKKGAKEHVILDLRDFNEYEAGHIKGSLSLPRRELDANIRSVVQERTKKVIVIVGPTQEQEIAEVFAALKKHGYQDVEFLAGGFDAWCEIAPIEIEPDLTELTPEEEGFTGKGEDDEEADPTDAQSEPLL